VTTPGWRPRSVLLTGSTGSLGGHLCADLLTHTAATVYCLVRAPDPASARHRLTTRLGELDDRPQTGERLVVVPGDLEQPGLGLTTRAYDALAETVDVVIHCAAGVNLAAPYDKLAPINVGGTTAMIGFADRATELTGRAPRFHLVSTLGTLIGARQAGWDEVDENTAPSMATAGHLGYPRSKTAAEIVARTAAERGLPVTVTRPGLVTGHSRTGRTFDSDLLVPLLRAAVAMGSAPTGNGAVPADMVDVVARAIVTLACRTDTAGRAFHLVRPGWLLLADVFDALRRAGHRLGPVEPDTWWAMVDEHATDPMVLPMAALAEVGRYMLAADRRHQPPRIRSDTTWAVLAESGVLAPPLGPAFLDRFVTGLTDTGVLPPAERPRHVPPTAVNRPTATIRVDATFDPMSFRDCSAGAAEAAAAAETAGFDGFWVPERQHDPLLALAAAAAATSTIELGTGVLIAPARNPMTVAVAAHDLHGLSGGRLLLGLGSQVPLHLTHRFSMPGDRLLARMREFTDALRTIWDCWNRDRPLDFRGRFYTHTLMTPYFAPPPNPYGAPRIFLSAVGPRMAELAGEIADGLIAPPFASRRHLAELLLPAVERGLATAGRTREEFTVVCNPLIATGHSESERSAAVERTRHLVAMFLSPLAYKPVLDLHGLHALGDKLTALTFADDPERWRRVGELIDDDTLAQFAITAAPNDVGEQAYHRFIGLADRVSLHAPHGPDAELWTTVARDLHRADGREPGPRDTA
jgi:probable F420-dependent oxidoreductase